MPNLRVFYAITLTKYSNTFLACNELRQKVPLHHPMCIERREDELQALFTL